MRTLPPGGRRTFRPRVECLEERALPDAAGLIVQFPLTASPNADHFAALAASRGATFLPTELPGAFRFTGERDALERLRAELSLTPDVIYAEPERTYSVALAPNDPRYTDGTLWGLSGTNGIKAPAAWDVTTGSTQVTVAVLDTGVNFKHPDLYLNIWINQGEIPASVKSAIQSDPSWDVDGDGLITFWDLNDARNQGTGKITDLDGDGRITGADLLYSTSAGGWADNSDTDGNGYKDDLIGWDFRNNDNNPSDDNGHGTHVAGTIGAVGNNSTGVVGVNWKVLIVPLKFLGSNGSGSDTHGAAATRYAADMGIPISNNSWGGGDYSTTLYNAISYANGKGHLFVAAAGNSGANADNSPDYPAAYNLANIVSVASTTSSGGLSSFSNYGATSVDLGAPGSSIYSTTSDGSYGTKSGTSMATPHVAGVAALVKAKFPTMTVSELKARLLDTVTPLTSLSGKSVSGGLVNAAQALDNSLPTNPTNLAATALSGNQIRLTWNDSTGEQGYRVERSLTGTSGWVQVSSTSANNVVTVNGALTSGATYYYRVVAFNYNGDSNFSNVASATTSSSSSTLLFSDGFDDASIGSDWTLKNGNWSESGGVLSQTSTGNADPRKAIVASQSTSGDQEITAKVRVDSWSDGDYARAGVGLRTDTSTGQGYNLLFHYSGGTKNRVQFLNDGVAWGNSYSFSWDVGTWYWFKLKVENAVLYGKVWKDGDTEPTTWAYTQTGWTARTTGAPSLNGGSAASGGGNATVSFDDVIITNPTAPTAPPATPGGLSATAVSPTQINLSWNDVSGEYGYKIERSLSSTGGWAEIATRGANQTTHQDTGLSDGTTYYYRVRAYNAAGNGDYSAVVQAITPAAGAAAFVDDFNDNTISSDWTLKNGSWSESGGVLSQTSTDNADPRKAIVAGQSTSGDQEITAKVRVNSWSDGAYARAGVGLRTDTSTGQGYNLLFHYDGGTKNKVQFLNDGVAWGNSYDFAWDVGTWYWFKLKIENGVLYGKVWKDGDAEPTNWLYSQSGWTSRTSGAPSLNGGAAASGWAGNATVSFDDVRID